MRVRVRRSAWECVPDFSDKLLRLGPFNWHTSTHFHPFLCTHSSTNANSPTRSHTLRHTLIHARPLAHTHTRTHTHACTHSLTDSTLFSPTTVDFFNSYFCFSDSKSLNRTLVKKIAAWSKNFQIFETTPDTTGSWNFTLGFEISAGAQSESFSLRGGERIFKMNNSVAQDLIHLNDCPKVREPEKVNLEALTLTACIWLNLVSKVGLEWIASCHGLLIVFNCWVFSSAEDFDVTQAVELALNRMYQMYRLYQMYRMRRLYRMYQISGFTFRLIFSFSRF